MPLDLVSLYTKMDLASGYTTHSPLRQWLTCYKGRIDESEPFVPEYVTVVKALVARFLYEHGDRITSRSRVDAIAVVPSSTRPGAHPLENVLADLPLTIPVETLLQRGPGELDHNKPSVDGFVPVAATARRVLLVDDVCTTGSRINSAAVALASAGHHVAGAFVIARRFNVGYGNTPQFWVEQKALPFTWEHGPLVNRQHRP